MRNKIILYHFVIFTFFSSSGVCVEHPGKHCVNFVQNGTSYVRLIFPNQLYTMTI